MKGIVEERAVELAEYIVENKTKLSAISAADLLPARSTET